LYLFIYLSGLFIYLFIYLSRLFQSHVIILFILADYIPLLFHYLFGQTIIILFIYLFYKTIIILFLYLLERPIIVLFIYLSRLNYYFISVFDVRRKADLRELRMLQKQENRQLAALDAKGLAAHDEENKRLEQEIQV